MTDDEGRSRLELAADARSLSFSAAGYRTLDLELPALSPGELKVVLTRLDCVAGRIHLGGAAPPGPTTVIAYPSHEIPTPAEQASMDRVHSAQSDASGRFEICGLDPEVSWTLLAGCPGHASPRPATDVLALQPPIDLELEAYVFLAVDCRLEGEDTPCFSSRLGGLTHGLSCVRRAGSSSGTSNDGRHVPLQAFLAGVPIDWCDLEVADSRRLLIHPASASLGAEELQCRAVLPGYELAWDRFGWLPLQEGFRVQSLRLKQVVEQWGQDHVHLQGLDYRALAEVDGQLSAPTLVLDPVDDGNELEYVLAGATTEGVILDCVPPGTYRWSLQPGILMSMIRYPAQVGPVLDVRGRIDLRIDFQACAALEILLRDESGAGYSGIASFRIGALRGGRLDAGTAFAMFEKAPYRLMGLPAGEYEVTLEQPPSAAGGSASTLRVSLAEGQRESIALVVRPP